ncbi:cupin domain-containing protein [Robiginitomaculum antarcticum]|uniref:cupin domain-containing protein n=1 Tax=Robiginitomaculum antarcticum TaxID=437507 RepID=UPI00037B7E20|nr:cupin domain-containing protein [Robiginitomaculum antarcticum]
MIQKINITDKFDLFSEHWRPKTVAEINGQEFKLAKIFGAYPWHAHAETDEMFFCWQGEFILDVEGEDSIVVKQGEAIVVPKGTVHRPRAESECQILLLETVGTKNNGSAAVDVKYDAPVSEWV